MSNYLYNIAARTLGLVETAQPLVTSLFEPPRDFKPVDAPQAFAPAEEPAPAPNAKDERAQPVSSINEERAQPVSFINQQRDAPALSLPAPALKSSSSLNAPPAAESQSRTSSAKHAPEKMGDPVTSLNQPAQHRTAQPVLLENQPPPALTKIKAPVFKTVEHQQTSRQTIRTPEHAPEASSNADLRNADAASFARQESRAEANARMTEPLRKPAPLQAQNIQLPSPVIERQVVERTLSRESMPSTSVEINNITEQRLETVIVKPQVSRYVETEQPEAMRAAQAEQVVQVTIGRIEVRAATAPPLRQTAPQKSSQQPSQSLEDYLRQRAQGGANR